MSTISTALETKKTEEAQALHQLSLGSKNTSRGDTKETKELQEEQLIKRTPRRIYSLDKLETLDLKDEDIIIDKAVQFPRGFKLNMENGDLTIEGDIQGNEVEIYVCDGNLTLGKVLGENVKILLARKPEIRINHKGKELIADYAIDQGDGSLMLVSPLHDMKKAIAEDGPGKWSVTTGRYHLLPLSMYQREGQFIIIEGEKFKIPVHSNEPATKGHCTALDIHPTTSIITNGEVTIKGLPMRVLKPHDRGIIEEDRLYPLSEACINEVDRIYDMLLEHYGNDSDSEQEYYDNIHLFNAVLDISGPHFVMNDIKAARESIFKHHAQNVHEEQENIPEGEKDVLEEQIDNPEGDEIQPEAQEETKALEEQEDNLEDQVDNPEAQEDSSEDDPSISNEQEDDQDEKENLLSVVAKFGSAAYLKLLLNRGAKVSHYDGYRYPLEHALAECNYDCATLLLEAGTRYNFDDRSNRVNAKSFRASALKRGPKTNDRLNAFITAHKKLGIDVCDEVSLFEDPEGYAGGESFKVMPPFHLIHKYRVCGDGSYEYINSRYTTQPSLDDVYESLVKKIILIFMKKESEERSSENKENKENFERLSLISRVIDASKESKESREAQVNIEEQFKQHFYKNAYDALFCPNKPQYYNKPNYLELFKYVIKETGGNYREEENSLNLVARAVRVNNIDYLKHLIEMKANVNDNDDEASPLILALENFHLEAAEILLKAGASKEFLQECLTKKISILNNALYLGEEAYTKLTDLLKKYQIDFGDVTPCYVFMNCSGNTRYRVKPPEDLLSLFDRDPAGLYVNKEMTMAIVRDAFSMAIETAAKNYFSKYNAAKIKFKSSRDFWNQHGSSSTEFFCQSDDFVLKHAPLLWKKAAAIFEKELAESRCIISDTNEACYVAREYFNRLSKLDDDSIEDMYSDLFPKDKFKMSSGRSSLITFFKSSIIDLLENTAHKPYPLATDFLENAQSLTSVRNGYVTEQMNENLNILKQGEQFILRYIKCYTENLESTVYSRMYDHLFNSTTPENNDLFLRLVKATGPDYRAFSLSSYGSVKWRWLGSSLLRKAIEHKRFSYLAILLEQKANVNLDFGDELLGDRGVMATDLGSALYDCQFETAEKLIKAGASLQCLSKDNYYAAKEIRCRVLTLGQKYSNLLDEFLKEHKLDFGPATKNYIYLNCSEGKEFRAQPPLDLMHLFEKVNGSTYNKVFYRKKISPKPSHQLSVVFLPQFNQTKVASGELIEVRIDIKDLQSKPVIAKADTQMYRQWYDSDSDNDDLDSSRGDAKKTREKEETKEQAETSEQSAQYSLENEKRWQGTLKCLDEENDKELSQEARDFIKNATAKRASETKRTLEDESIEQIYDWLFDHKILDAGKAKVFVKLLDITGPNYCRQGKSPGLLIRSAMGGHLDYLEILIKSGASVLPKKDDQHSSDSNRSPLYYALTNEHFECAMSLVDAIAHDPLAGLDSSSLYDIQHAVGNYSRDNAFLIAFCKNLSDYRYKDWSFDHREKLGKLEIPSENSEILPLSLLSSSQFLINQNLRLANQWMRFAKHVDDLMHEIYYIKNEYDRLFAFSRSGVIEERVFESLLNQTGPDYCMQGKLPSLVMRAAEGGHLNYLKILIKRGANLLAKDADYFASPPLYHALMNQHFECAEALVKASSDNPLGSLNSHARHNIATMLYRLIDYKYDFPVIYAFMRNLEDGDKVWSFSHRGKVEETKVSAEKSEILDKYKYQPLLSQWMLFALFVDDLMYQKHKTATATVVVAAQQTSKLGL